jgi:hypothetical protein
MSSLTDFLIDNFWLTGYFMNATVFFAIVTYFIYVTSEVGPAQVKAIVDARDYTVSKWVYVTWLIPYIGVYSGIRFLYRWNRIDADSLLERLVKFETIGFSWVTRKLFVRDKEKQSTTNSVTDDVVHSSDAL